MYAVCLSLEWRKFNTAAGTAMEHAVSSNIVDLATLVALSLITGNRPASSPGTKGDVTARTAFSCSVHDGSVVEYGLAISVS